MTTTKLTAKNARPAADYQEALVRVDDFQHPQGWVPPASATDRSRQCCEQLEAGQVLFMDRIPYFFPQADREFLLSQRQSGSRLHKNVPYRPLQDVLRGAAGDASDQARLHDIMRRYSAEVARFLGQLLQPYAAHWTLDYAGFSARGGAGPRSSSPQTQ